MGRQPKPLSRRQDGFDAIGQCDGEVVRVSREAPMIGGSVTIMPPLTSLLSPSKPQLPDDLPLAQEDMEDQVKRMITSIGGSPQHKAGDKRAGESARR